ncbi:tripartite tricarboxylate transporter substrate binding protein [Prauserella flavalba]|uniref:Tripartite tricarboxylate transporter substrate binding protein n=1 Tax=Prauserella flavalba TaxID=1477506 RepID=A0A318LHB8_9PSEU|nr:tripartite tricarboxylate transporter substrate binding protein [Prauserella flavalba]PXY18723.1 hypothetical protein BA062_34520 [Prauserella flavalba]
MPPVSRRRVLALAALALSTTACSTGERSGTAPEGAYPAGQIRWIVPYGAGGNTDLVSRAVAKAMSDELGQTIVVENLPGASGAVGMQTLITAAPDGYTIGLVTGSTAVLVPMQNDLDFDRRSITSIGLMLEQPSILAVGPGSRFRTAREFFSEAKRNPGTLTVAVPGASTPGAIELLRLAREYGVEATGVPFDSNAEVLTMLLGDNVDAIFVPVAADVVKNLEAGTIVPLAASPRQRLDWLPQVPTLVELGFPELYQASSPIGLAAPANLPAPVRDELVRALGAALTDPAVVEAIDERFIPETFGGPEAMDARFASIHDAYLPVFPD